MGPDTRGGGALRMSEVAKMLPKEVTQVHHQTNVAGWSAVYASEAPDRVGNPFTVIPLIGTALIEDEHGSKTVVGLVPEGLEFVVCLSPSFLGYLAPSQSVDEFLPILAEWERDQNDDPETGADRKLRQQMEATIRETKKDGGN